MPADPNYKWGTDYGKDLLKDINQLAHAAGTGALHRDMLQRAYREIRRLAAAPASPLRGRDRDLIALDAAHQIEALPSDLHKAQKTARIQLIVLHALHTSPPEQPAPPVDAAAQYALDDVAEWCMVERDKLGAVDGYDYRSGEEFGLRRAEIELRRRAKAAVTSTERAPAAFNIGTYIDDNGDDGR